MILVGSMSSKLGVIAEINSTYPDGIPKPNAVIVRAEEALIVILVLLLWAAAIALFFNRWRKIRMLEPYQPKFQQEHRQSCTTIEQNQLQNRCTFSKCNILCGDYPAGHELNYISRQMRPRQNSVFIGSSMSFLPGGEGIPRRTKSALDLQFLMFSENNTSNEQNALKNLKPANESTKLLQDERKANIGQLSRLETSKSAFRNRGMSICQLDASPKLWQRDRRMSVCQFDRMEVLARPLQRNRGGSICHFDRMDVLARPLQRDRIGSAYRFDRMDVLARPNFSLGKILMSERRVSMSNFLEKDEGAAKGNQIARRLSSNGVEKIEKAASVDEAVCEKKKEKFAKYILEENKNTSYQLDQPSCSNAPESV
ncbi:uncharacterized protein LOC122574179 isoform X1 [Bombus pyrosoma]|uniref:uncharacterized protein LOC122574179 isoform X1 n=2 Tax=Bombus pyrosoma TaxID=396416 RepID=UPI001CB976A7|nr:uncharacterized protein LOC122574179 isoform X1 [Bombus pyrosoma]